MNMLKITIPTGALLVTALMAGTAIANNETGATTVEELIINDTSAQENSLTTPKDMQSYEIASADGDENECEDEDDDENETGDDEDKDDDDEEYAACADQPAATQG